MLAFIRKFGRHNKHPGREAGDLLGSVLRPHAPRARAAKRAASCRRSS